MPTSAGPRIYGVAVGEAIALTVRRHRVPETSYLSTSECCPGRTGVPDRQTKGWRNLNVPVQWRSVLSGWCYWCEGRSPDDLLFPGRGGGHPKRPSHDSTGWFNRVYRSARRRSRRTICGTHAPVSRLVQANVLAVSADARQSPSDAGGTGDLSDSDLDAVAVSLDARIAVSVRASQAPG